MRCNLLLTGDELMSGDVIDSNSAMIATQFAQFGWSVERRVTVGDSPEALLSAMQWLTQDCDLLIINGGLGPTVDDLTAEVLAKLLKAPLEEHPIALSHLESWCQRRRIKLCKANRKQALLPAGVTIVNNATGSAVGFAAEYHGTLIICTPGVPSELQTMLSEEIVPMLQERFNALPYTVDRLTLFGVGESSAQGMIETNCPDWPESIKLGFRAASPTIEVKLSSQESPECRQQWLQRLTTLFADHVVDTKSSSPAQRLVELLTEHNQQITVAESCTGGLIASQLTEISGSSAIFEAGFVTYSNAIKTDLLGVPAELIEAHGAVSQAVVEAMAQGALKRSGADYVIAVSGVAGPSGGTPEKPVGTVWIAWGSHQQIHTEGLRFRGNRKMVQTMAAATALDLLRRNVLQLNQQPDYLRHRRIQAE